MSDNNQKNYPKIIVALDFDAREPTLAFVQQLDPKLCRLKIGSILFTRCGPALVKELTQQGFDLFLDLKFHDIPNTVAGACLSAAELGVWMLTIHTAGGKTMMQAAKQAIDDYKGDRKPLLVGVTVLTSLDNQDLQAIGMKDKVEILVPHLAQQAHEAGLDGVVCSPHEAAILRQQLPEEFLLITPGIRLSPTETKDQKRIMTPNAALESGSDFLVIGRAITDSENPYTTLNKINSDISQIADKGIV